MTATHGQSAAAEARPDDWWKTAVVYQIYPRSFNDSNSDGIGDLPGILTKLDYLEHLGVDVVWLSPVYTSPQDDNGYDIADYQDIDPLFGTLSDIDALVAGLHSRGMKLMMDLVVNHTSDEHPWFQESRDPASPKRDWYWWRPARDGYDPGAPGGEPTNWGAAFSGPAWEFDELSGEYFLHMFSRKQPDLNWENQEMRQAIYTMMRWWVARGIDGFRMDVINLISKPLELLDGPLVDGHLFHPAFLPVANGPRLDGFLSEMNHEVGLDARNLITVGEMPGSSIATAQAATDATRGELSMVFTFEHMSLDQQPGGQKWDLADAPLPVLKRNLADWQEGLADAGWNSLYWNNHDQPRVVSRFGDDSPRFRVASAKTLATVLHMHRGTPYVYQGEEIGMTNALLSDIADYADLESLNHHAEAMTQGADPRTVMASLAAKSRDNARTPMQWDDSPNAGFTIGTLPWLSVNPNHTEINASAAINDPESVFYHYRKLIELRHTNPTVVEGRFSLLLPEHPTLWAFTRTGEHETLLVLGNLSAEPLPLPTADLPDLTSATLLLGTHTAVPDTLAGWESRIMKL